MKHIVYHRTSFVAANQIVRDRALRAKRGLMGTYDVNSGPFFFVEGMAEGEIPTGHKHHEIALRFECRLREYPLSRNSQHIRDMNAGRFDHLRNKLILEYHPIQSDQLTQARIVPRCMNCLTLVGYEAGETMSWALKRRWRKFIAERPCMSIEYW